MPLEEVAQQAVTRIPVLDQANAVLILLTVAILVWTGWVGLKVATAVALLTKAITHLETKMETEIARVFSEIPQRIMDEADRRYPTMEDRDRFNQPGGTDVRQRGPNGR